MEHTINLRKLVSKPFANSSIKIAIIIIALQLTSASQVYFLENITKYTAEGQLAVLMSWIVPLALEIAAGVVIYKLIEVFSYGAKIVAVFILLPIFFVIAVINFMVSQNGILTKGIQEVQATKPDPTKKLKEVENTYLPQLQVLNNSYQITRTEHIDLQINELLEEKDAIQKATDKCNCPAWSNFQEKQSAKKRDLDRKISRLERSRIEINNQNTKILAAQSQAALPLQDAMKKALQAAEKENEKDEIAYQNRFSDKITQIKSVHASLSFMLILLAIVLAFSKNPQTTLAFEKKLSLSSTKMHKIPKKPADFRQDFLDFIFVDNARLNMTQQEIAKAILSNQKLDGKFEALVRNISDWKTDYKKSLQEETQTTPPPQTKKEEEKAHELPPRTKEAIQNRINAGDSRSMIFSRFSNFDKKLIEDFLAKEV